MFQEQQSCRIISANPNQSGPNLSDVLRSRVDNMQEILATNGPLPMGGGELVLGRVLRSRGFCPQHIISATF